MARRRHPRALAFMIRISDTSLEEYTYAIVVFTEKMLLWYYDRLKFAAKLDTEDSSFYSLAYFDYVLTYFSTFGALDYMPEYYEDIAEYGEWLRIPSALASRLQNETRDMASTNCEQVVVCKNYLYWQCYVKNTSCRLESDTLSLEQLLGLFDEARWFENE